MKSYPNFAVILAAYNGMVWIAEQVDSILQQSGVSVTVYISVDESTDDTLAWCLARSQVDSRIVVLPSIGRFGGAAKNFFRLIQDVDFSGFDYLALADQDDLWSKDKLASAHEKIIKKGVMGYSGSVTAFWPDGRNKLIDKAQSQRKYDFLFEAAGPGCTYVLKSSGAVLFKRFLLKNKISVDAVALHDWLIYAWYRANGLAWYIDSVPKMLYRQHDLNQVGANFGVKAVISRFKLLRAGWYRAEVSKITNLLSEHLPDVPKSLADNGDVPWLFLMVNLNNFRRRFRDQIFLAAIIIFGIY
tara:strand:- start:4576 stop:5478 length:903 start_codon:yes stop_codon:yes gene_type:complete